jgi:hypothetical protein
VRLRKSPIFAHAFTVFSEPTPSSRFASVVPIHWEQWDQRTWRALSEGETETTTSSFLESPRAKEILANRAPTAYRLTDRQGNRAYVWWEVAGRPVVDADDPGFRRRVQRALKKPIWTVEDERDGHGFTLTTRVLLPPDAPRYPSRLLFRWDQLGIRDLEEVEGVRREDRQPVRTLLTLLAGTASPPTSRSSWPR